VHTKAPFRPDLLLLVSLLVVILLNPVLDHGDLGKPILGISMFAPVILATVRLSEAKNWLWSSGLLMLATLIVFVASTIFPIWAIIGIKWEWLAAFFSLTVVGLFSYLRSSRSLTTSHLFTAASIYLLGMLWFALYSDVDIIYPGSFVPANNTAQVAKASFCTLA